MMLGLRLAIASALFTSASAFTAPAAAYGIGKPAFNEYRKYASEAGRLNLSQVSADLTENNIEPSADPKADLVTLIVNNLRSTDGSGDYKEEGKIDALIAQLQAEGKGFSSVTVDGDWSAVLSRQGKKSTKSQKFVSNKQDVTSSLSNFRVKAMEFDNLVSTPRGNGLLKAVVKYNPIAKGFDKKDGKIVLRRIACDIESASFKYWKFPTLYLPFLKSKGGYLDFLYLDQDIRITKGNRGGLFVHFRPEFLEKVLK